MAKSRQFPGAWALRFLPALLIAVLLPFLAATRAYSALQETWFIDHEPRSAEFSRWGSSTQGKVLRIQLDATPSVDLAPRLKHAAFSRVQILSNTYPTSGTFAAWKSLADQGAEFVAMVGIAPTPQQVELLNAIGFRRLLIVMTRYLEYGTKNPLLGLKVPFDLHFALNRYPQYLQKYPIAELPLDVAVQISVDYWPRYIQMDNLNLIPQEKTLRVRGTPLSSGSIPYVQGLKNVRELVFESDFEPPHSQWISLEKFSTRWILKGRLPSDAALESLKEWNRRTGTPFQLTLDPGRAPNAEERSRYDTLPFPVEWTADAP